MKALEYLSLFALASQAAAGLLRPRDESVALPTIHFTEEAVLAQGINRTVVPCNAPDDCPEQEEHALEKRRQSPFNVCSKHGSRLFSSRCRSAFQLQVTCFNRVNPPNAERFTSYTVYCRVPLEVCIQNASRPPYALCQDMTGLVKWYTDPEGGDSKSTRYFHATNKNQKSYGVNNYFDKNNNPISVGNTYFYTEPGRVWNNFIMSASVAATKGLIDWLKVQNLRTDVYTGGAGGLMVLSFVMA